MPRPYNIGDPLMEEAGSTEEDSYLIHPFWKPVFQEYEPSSPMESMFSKNTNLPSPMESKFSKNTNLPSPMESKFSKNTSLSSPVESKFSKNTSLSSPVESKFSKNTSLSSPMESKFSKNTNLPSPMESPSPAKAKLGKCVERGARNETKLPPCRWREIWRNTSFTTNTESLLAFLPKPSPPLNCAATNKNLYFCGSEKCRVVPTLYHS